MVIGELLIAWALGVTLAAEPARFNETTRLPTGSLSYGFDGDIAAGSRWSDEKIFGTRFGGGLAARYAGSFYWLDGGIGARNFASREGAFQQLGSGAANAGLYWRFSSFALGAAGGAAYYPATDTGDVKGGISPEGHFLAEWRSAPVQLFLELRALNPRPAFTQTLETSTMGLRAERLVEARFNARFLEGETHPYLELSADGRGERNSVGGGVELISGALATHIGFSKRIFTKPPIYGREQWNLYGGVTLLADLLPPPEEEIELEKVKQGESKKIVDETPWVTVEGRITDEEGRAVSRANVSYQGVKLASSNAKGEYRLVLRLTPQILLTVEAAGKRPSKLDLRPVKAGTLRSNVVLLKAEPPKSQRKPWVVLNLTMPEPATAPIRIAFPNLAAQYSRLVTADTRKVSIQLEEGVVQIQVNTPGFLAYRDRLELSNGDVKNIAITLRAEARVVAPKTQVVMKKEGLVIRERIKFEQNSVRIDLVSFDMLTRLAQLLISDKTWYKLQIEGHTDNTGADAYNMSLGLARAESVKAFLVSQGVAADRVATVSWAARRPVASNDTEEDRALNRRVEFNLLARE